MNRGDWWAIAHGVIKELDSTQRLNNNPYYRFSWHPGLPWWLQTVKNPPAVRETWVRSLGWDNLLKEGRAWPPIPVTLPGESPWTEGPGGLQSMGSQRVRHD